MVARARNALIVVGVINKWLGSFQMNRFFLSLKHQAQPIH